MFLLLLSNEVCQSIVKGVAHTPHTSCGSEHKGCEHTMFDFTDPITILSLFQVYYASCRLLGELKSDCRACWDRTPLPQKNASWPLLQKSLAQTSRRDFGSVIAVWWLKVSPCCEWLKEGFCCNIVAYLCEQRCYDIANLKGFKTSFVTRTSDTVRTHLQCYQTLGEGVLKLYALQSPCTGDTQTFPPRQAASVRPRFEPSATPPSRVTSRGYYRCANPPPMTVYSHQGIYYMNHSFMVYSTSIPLTTSVIRSLR